MADDKAQKGATATAPADGRIPAPLLKLVQRPVLKDGKVVMEGSGEKATPKLRAIKPGEVFAWREYPDRVAVVTDDGRKFVGQKS
jgi:hypothetical protein